MQRLLVKTLCFYFMYGLSLLPTPSTQAQLTSEFRLGIEELHHLPERQAHALVSSTTRPLFTPVEQETFLKELEGEVPNWPVLHDQPTEEHGERLFAFNRIRDEEREGHILLRQKIAYVWTGLLRHYVPEHEGYSIAMGPDITKTTWGIIRFKPVGLPQEMIAIPSPKLRPSLQEQLAQGKQVEIKILFTGRLLPNESIIYAFSHDDPNQGMIIPVVQTENVQYFLPSTE